MLLSNPAWYLSQDHLVFFSNRSQAVRFERHFFVKHPVWARINLLPSESDLDCQTNKKVPCHRFFVMYKWDEAGNYLFLFYLNSADRYRCCAFMMTEGEVAYANHYSVYHVLKEAGILQNKQRHAKLNLFLIGIIFSQNELNVFLFSSDSLEMTKSIMSKR